MQANVRIAVIIFTVIAAIIAGVYKIYNAELDRSRIVYEKKLAKEKTEREKLEKQMLEEKRKIAELQKQITKKQLEEQKEKEIPPNIKICCG